jgi:hypothetical protein
MSIRKGRKERGSREEGKTEVRKKYERLGRESNIFNYVTFSHKVAVLSIFLEKRGS